MKKISLLFSFLFSLLITLKAPAQGWYAFSSSNQTYTPLTGATTVTTGLWSDTDFVMIPLSLNFDINGQANSGSLIIAGGSFLFLENTNQFTLTTGTIMTLKDRGSISGTPVSPIRYTVTGATGSRIMKIEITNAGFTTEQDSFGTLNDFVNMQYWLYEGTDVIEIHYGSSQISNFAKYFEAGGVFYVMFLDDGVGNEKGYVLKGNPASPIVDSTGLDITTILSAYPANGTVYRFTPLQGVGVKNVSAMRDIKVCPTVCTDKLNIVTNNTAPMDYRITSTSGITMNSGIVNDNIKIDVSTLPGGMYFLQLQDAESRATYRFIKE